MFVLLLSLLAQPALGGDTVSVTATPHLATATAGDGHQVAPTWEADGSHLAYRLERGDGSSCVKMVAVAGDAPGAAQTVYLPGGAFTGGVGCRVGAMGWHPDGILVFTASNQGNPNRLYFTRPSAEDTAASGELVSPEQLAGDLVSPSVAAATGHVVAFIARTGKNADVYLWTPANEAVTRVTETDAIEGEVAVDGEGDAIAFLSTTFDEGERLLIYDVALEPVEAADDGGGKKKKKKAAEESAEGMQVTGVSERARVDLTGDAVRPTWSGSDVLFFVQWEDRWQLRRLTSELSTEVVFDDLDLPQNTPPAVTGDGKWAAWVRQNSDAVYFGSRDRTKLVEVHTGLEGLTDPALVQRDGHVLAAFSAYGEGSSYRRVYLMDVTEALGQ